MKAFKSLIRHQNTQQMDITHKEEVVVRVSFSINERQQLFSGRFAIDTPRSFVEQCGPLCLVHRHVCEAHVNPRANQHGDQAMTRRSSFPWTSSLQFQAVADSNAAENGHYATRNTADDMCMTRQGITDKGNKLSTKNNSVEKMQTVRHVPSDQHSQYTRASPASSSQVGAATHFQGRGFTRLDRNVGSAAG